MKNGLIHPKVREEFYISSYIEWCQSVTIDNTELQKVLANPAISKWFSMEYAKCEEEFEIRVKDYHGYVSNDTILECYADCTTRLFNIRPMAILNDIKKKEPSVKGIKVLTNSSIYYAN